MYGVFRIIACVWTAPCKTLIKISIGRTGTGVGMSVLFLLLALLAIGPRRRWLVGLSTMDSDMKVLETRVMNGYSLTNLK